MKICKAESFHQSQGFEACMALAQGSETQRQMLQDAIKQERVSQLGHSKTRKCVFALGLVYM